MFPLQIQSDIQDMCNQIQGRIQEIQKRLLSFIDTKNKTDDGEKEKSSSKTNLQGAALLDHLTSQKRLKDQQTLLLLSEQQNATCRSKLEACNRDKHRYAEILKTQQDRMNILDDKIEHIIQASKSNNSSTDTADMLRRIHVDMNDMRHQFNTTVEALHHEEAHVILYKQHAELLHRLTSALARQFTENDASRMPDTHRGILSNILNALSPVIEKHKQERDEFVSKLDDWHDYSQSFQLLQTEHLQAMLLPPPSSENLPSCSLSFDATPNLERARDKFQRVLVDLFPPDASNGLEQVRTLLLETFTNLAAEYAAKNSSAQQQMENKINTFSWTRELEYECNQLASLVGESPISAPQTSEFLTNSLTRLLKTCRLKLGHLTPQFKHQTDNDNKEENIKTGMPEANSFMSLPSLPSLPFASSAPFPPSGLQKEVSYKPPAQPSTSDTIFPNTHHTPILPLRVESEPFAPNLLSSASSSSSSSFSSPLVDLQPFAKQHQRLSEIYQKQIEFNTNLSRRLYSLGYNLETLAKPLLDQVSSLLEQEKNLKQVSFTDSFNPRNVQVLESLSFSIQDLSAQLSAFNRSTAQTQQLQEENMQEKKSLETVFLEFRDLGQAVFHSLEHLVSTQEPRMRDMQTYFKQQWDELTATMRQNQSKQEEQTSALMAELQSVILAYKNQIQTTETAMKNEKEHVQYATRQILEFVDSQKNHISSVLYNSLNSIYSYIQERQEKQGDKPDFHAQTSLVPMHEFAAWATNMQTSVETSVETNIQAIYRLLEDKLNYLSETFDRFTKTIHQIHKEYKQHQDTEITSLVEHIRILTRTHSATRYTQDFLTAHARHMETQRLASYEILQTMMATQVQEMEQTRETISKLEEYLWEEPLVSIPDNVQQGEEEEEEEKESKTVKHLESIETCSSTIVHKIKNLLEEKTTYLGDQLARQLLLGMLCFCV